MKRTSSFRSHLIRAEELKPPFLVESEQVIVVVTYRIPGSDHHNVSWDTSWFRALRRSARLFNKTLPDRVRKRLV